MAWSFEYAVESDIARPEAWRFWTNVQNWLFDVSVESVSIDGPFVAGTRGRTIPRGAEPLEWELEAVDDERSATIAIPMPGATARFEWRFEDRPRGGTQITQLVSLTGERASDYADGTAALEQGIPQGMRKLVELMAATE